MKMHVYVLLTNPNLNSFECGVRRGFIRLPKFSLGFFLVGLIFVLFDLETIFVLVLAFTLLILLIPFLLLTLVVELMLHGLD